jgi:hypothetical protein
MNNVFIQSGGGRRPFEATATGIPCSKKEKVGANSCPDDKATRGQMGTVPEIRLITSILKALS